jgi:hypothetical protein
VVTCTVCGQGFIAKEREGWEGRMCGFEWVILLECLAGFLLENWDILPSRCNTKWYRSARCITRSAVILLS